MPYKSAKQEKFFNAERGKKVPAKVVDEFNAASKGMKLPEAEPVAVAKKEKAMKPGAGITAAVVFGKGGKKK